MAKVFWYLIVPILAVLWMYQAYAAAAPAVNAAAAISTGHFRAAVVADRSRTTTSPGLPPRMKAGG